MKLNKYAKDRTISWLESMQKDEAFQGQPENEMDFRKLSDDDLIYYFLEWYFTDDDQTALENDEIELLQERKRILKQNI
ncbi:hypothetical protein T548_0049 [Lactococcus phage phiL47]|uniref:Uncharacterized protein n=1 Tax=Lactococcus phage phiL47 TaxID=1412875 RepID=V9VHV7_9CAUD|nr:hypothetical protein T548_0049 [Lactococcus phage phiL47]AHC94127.1 hypothetical protein T548_0049 [Lactococcus phage phiL47]